MLQRHMLAVKKVDVSTTGLMLLNNGIAAVMTAAFVGAVAPGEWHAFARSVADPRTACVVGVCVESQDSNCAAHTRTGR